MATVVGPSGRVAALDINTRCLDAPALPQLEIRHGDVIADPLESKTYDVIHGRFVLLHVKDMRVALANLWQALKPGGVVFWRSRISGRRCRPLETGSEAPVSQE